MWGGHRDRFQQGLDRVLDVAAVAASVSAPIASSARARRGQLKARTALTGSQSHVRTSQVKPTADQQLMARLGARLVTNR
jgi:hypothetical protein